MTPDAPMDAEEVAWARDCAAAGDTPAEIAEAAGRPLEDIEAALAGLRPMTARQREIASLWAAGLTQQAIAEQVGIGGKFAKNSVGGRLKDLRRNGYSVPERADRWTERRQTILDRQERHA